MEHKLKGKITKATALKDSKGQMSTSPGSASAAQGAENQAPSQQAWRENLNVTISCPDCKIFPPDLIEEHADTICANCGRVLAERMISYESEWRTFNNDEKGGDDPNRVGDGTNELLATDQGTMIGGDGRNGNKITRSLKKAQAMQNEDKHNRKLQDSYRKIDEWADREYLSNAVKQEAKRIFKQTYDAGVFRGKSEQAVLASCLFVSLRTNHVPRSFAEIMYLTSVPKKELGRTFKQVEKFLHNIAEEKTKALEAEGLSVDPTTVQYVPTASTSPKDLVGRYCNQMGLPQRINIIGARLAEKMNDTTGLTGRSPLSAAGACIYFVCHLLGQPRSLVEISQVANVSEATIKQAYKKLLEFKDQFIEPGWLGEQHTGFGSGDSLFGDASKLPKAN